MSEWCCAAALQWARRGKGDAENVGRHHECGNGVHDVTGHKWDDGGGGESRKFSPRMSKALPQGDADQRRDLCGNASGSLCSFMECEAFPEADLNHLHQEPVTMMARKYLMGNESPRPKVVSFSLSWREM